MLFLQIKVGTFVCLFVFYVSMESLRNVLFDLNHLEF